MKRHCYYSNWNITSTDRRSAIDELLADVSISGSSKELLSVALQTVKAGTTQMFLLFVL